MFTNIEGAIRSRKSVNSYTAVFRLAEAVGRLDQEVTQVANTNKQWATIHHTASSSFDLRLCKCEVYITDWSAGTQGILELRQLSSTTPPATGNPAIVPAQHIFGISAPVEAECLYLPTTQGSENAVNGPLAHIPLDVLAYAKRQPAFEKERGHYILYDASNEDPELPNLMIKAGVFGGWAVMLRTVGAPSVRMTVVMRFSEELFPLVYN